jgi:hypothetical protein
MNTEFIDILKKLIAEQGKEALLNPAKCKAFLADYTHGEYKKESRLLLQSLDAGVQKAIDTTEELEICKKQQTRVLQEEYFLAAETAADVVETLALVLREDKQKEKPKITLCANCGKELQKEWKACPYCLTPLAKTNQVTGSAISNKSNKNEIEERIIEISKNDISLINGFTVLKNGKTGILMRILIFMGFLLFIILLGSL